ncbi:hypothetical protein LUZ63_014450 [Rhynchospora breviuscula]|uniref:protein-serine/threonine phosphatase n=1 Tax=Rhynchospora breviuscula TaxID=2022672 RepID=A0A9Q0CAH3_9POAL|nr:hypothetical protein LUZ63_014450 [Rhynchospora breviuscula]
MAEVCCEVATGTDGTTTNPISQPKSRGARRRRVEIRRLRPTSSDPPETLDRKRHRDASTSWNDESGSSDQSPRHGMSSVCGRRRDMEDAVSVRPNFVEVGCAYHFYGVFDGHGCCHVAVSCKDRMPEIVSEEMIKKGGEAVKGEEWWKGVMERSFVKMDGEVSEGEGKPVSSNCPCVLRTQKSDHVGSTAVVSVVGPKHIIVANCGDSRAVLCRDGTPVALSTDHKPDRPDELKRIEDAGGRVIYWDGARVLGMLAMSRAIGDNYLKPYVIPDPEVTVTERSNSDEFLILASDGLWDVVSNEQACQIVRTCFRPRSSKVKRDEIVEELEEKAKVEPGSSKACANAAMLLTKVAMGWHSADNISVVVVDLRSRKL